MASRNSRRIRQRGIFSLKVGAHVTGRRRNRAVKPGVQIYLISKDCIFHIVYGAVFIVALARKSQRVFYSVSEHQAAGNGIAVFAYAEVTDVSAQIILYFDNGILY